MKANRDYEIGMRYKLGQYTGEVKRGIPEGHGTFYQENGDEYEGEFFRGMYHGKGKLSQKNGWIWEGEFVYGQLIDNGRVHFPNGDVYEGNIVNTKCTGKGVYKWADGSKYEGDFIWGARTGKGKYTDIEGTIYEGVFFNGVYKGKDTILQEGCAISDNEKCPHCGKDVSLYYADGTPLRLCPFCKKPFLIRGCKEIAAEKLPTKHDNLNLTTQLLLFVIGTILLVIASCIITSGSSIVRLLMLFTGIVLIGYGLFDTVKKLNGYVIRSKKDHFETYTRLAQSQARLKNHNYSILLKELGYEIPDIFVN